MAQQRLQLGDQKTADIKLRLIGSDGVDYGGNPVYLHFQVLRKSEFYKTMLSDRWSSLDERPLELKVTSYHCFEHYIKCIEVMYQADTTTSLCFCNVDEALAILPIASELLFHYCINECMRYLDAVRLNSLQEAQLRELLSSLQINVSPYMAARLGMNPCRPYCGHLELVEEFLPEMLSMVSNGMENRNGLRRKAVEKYCVAYFTKASESSAISQKTCKLALWKEFTANMGRIKCNDISNIKNAFSALSWIVGVIRRCDGKWFGEAMKIFCEDVEFCSALSTNRFTYSVDNIKEIVNLLICRLLKGLSNGEIITSPSFRICFLTKWIETMVELISRSVSERGKYVPNVANM